MTLADGLGQEGRHQERTKLTRKYSRKEQHSLKNYFALVCL
jgi:hypothetical protein